MRLKSRSDFLSVYEASRSDQGRVFRQNLITFYVHSDSQPARLGLSVAKKRLKRAHDRNQVKRWLRELFRQHRSELNGKIVIRWDASEEQIEFEKVRRDFLDFVERYQKWLLKKA